MKFFEDNTVPKVVKRIKDELLKVNDIKEFGVDENGKYYHDHDNKWINVKSYKSKMELIANHKDFNPFATMYLFSWQSSEFSEGFRQIFLNTLSRYVLEKKININDKNNVVYTSTLKSLIYLKIEEEFNKVWTTNEFYNISLKNRDWNRARNSDDIILFKSLSTNIINLFTTFIKINFDELIKDTEEALKE